MIATSEEICFPARDGATLTADLHLPAGRPAAAIVLAPAMGVPRAFYRRFGQYLAEHGALVLAFDYRGIAGSRAAATSSTRLRDWGELDAAGAVDYVAALAPAVPIRYCGHSVGGQLFGLMEDVTIERALFVGSQSGYAGHWDGIGRLAMTALWFAFVPVAVAVTGRLPMRSVGQGEDVPSGVGREWASWGRHPRYIGAYADVKPRCLYATFSGKICAYAITDDDYAPRRAVDGLLAEYKASDSELRVVAPQDLGRKSLGHFGTFKRGGETLWPGMRRFLLEGGPTS
ncbi:alpha/beta fold hydrolase [soil metagenome]